MQLNALCFYSACREGVPPHVRYQTPTGWEPLRGVCGISSSATDRDGKYKAVVSFVFLDSLGHVLQGSMVSY